jgi:hypothetical protein
MYRTSVGRRIAGNSFADPFTFRKTPSKPGTSHAIKRSEDSATSIKRIRETWVQEFNAGRADKVAALYAEEAVLMRKNDSLHNRDSI